MSTRIVPPSPRLLRALAIMANKSDKAGRYVARPENGGYAIYRPESPGEMRIRENPLGASVDLFINDALAFSAPDYDDVAQYAQETYALSAFRLRDLHRDYVSNRNNTDMSVAIRKAWIATDMPLIKLDELDDYVKQLSTGDKELLRQHHVERFVQEHLTGDMQPIPPAKLERLESFVMGTTPVLKAWNLADMQWPKDAAPVKEGDSWANMSNWPFIPVPTPMDRLANVLIQAYTIDEIVPLLEAYQGHRALDGGMKASEFVADVKTYLQERAAAHNPVIQEPSISTTLAPQ